MNRQLENLKKYIESEKVYSIEKLIDLTKLSKQQVESKILKLALTNNIDKTLAKLILRESPIKKLLELNSKSGLKGTIPNNDTRIQTTTL